VSSKKRIKSEKDVSPTSKAKKKNIKQLPVALIGAGPGDPMLLTIRGYQRLQESDVVMTDALLTDGLRELIPRKAEVVYVGKRAGAHSHSQDEINKILFNKVKEGKRVVRLKGGDPFVFGRGAEEAEYLIKKGIEVEIIPGLSSALTVPAMAGIPVLHREIAGTVLIMHGQIAPPRLEEVDTVMTDEDESAKRMALTPDKGAVIIRRRKKRSDEDSSSNLSTRDEEESGIRAKTLKEIDWKASCTAGDTIVFLMFVSNMHAIKEGLLYGGRKHNEPVAAIQWGTTPEQRVLISTIDKFPRKFQRQDLKAPAVLVVGEVVKCSEALNQINKKPLYGKTVLLTQREEGLQTKRRLFEEMGAKVEVLPLIEVPPLADDPKVLDSIAFELEDATHIILTQEDLAETFEAALERSGMDSVEYFHQTVILCTDIEMLHLVESLGLKGKMLPRPITKDSLVETLGMAPQTARIVVVEDENEWNTIGDDLEEFGAKPFTITISRERVDDKALLELRQRMKKKEFQIIVWEHHEAIEQAHSSMGSKAEDLMNSIVHLTFDGACNSVLQGFQVDAFAECKSMNPEEILEVLKPQLAWMEE